MSAGPGPAAGVDPRTWTRDAFAAGDHAGTAMYGDPATLEYHAARALVVGDEASFAALAQFTTPEARFHAAAARFVHGDTDGARARLAGLELPAARNLARLLARDRIHVLAQLPWLPGAMTDLLAGAREDRLFAVRHIGHRHGDRQNAPYTNVARFVDDGFVPDFFVATMVEWHHLPPDLQALRCPLFGWVADHDLHIQTITPWLDLFDELCVTDRTEWLDVQGLSRGRVSSFPHVFGMPAQLPPIPHGERHLDFFVSGTMLDPYHPDKARVLHELLAMPDLAMRVVRGFTGPMAFYALLAASKASFTFVRRPGAMPTRGLESLALGCAVALQRESILNLWVGANEGVVRYGPERGALATAVRTIAEHWDHFGPAAARGAALVREQFSMPRVASRWLRYLTVRAAMPRPERRTADTSRWCQKRLCVSRTWLVDDPALRRRAMQANFRRLGEAFAAGPTATTLVDMARELLCEFVYYEQKGQVGDDERALRDDAIGLLEKGLRSFPRKLAIAFLLMRTWWHHGDARQRMRALQLAHDTLTADPAGWQIGADDDVMPFDFHADCFNYRDYLDLVARAAKGERVATAAYVRLIRAALAGYLARKTGKVALHEQAAALDPGFARYRFDLARCLLTHGGAAARPRALALLRELADGSAEFVAAARELARVDDAFGAAPEDAAAAHALQRLDADTIDASRRIGALFATERREAKAAGVVRVAVPDQDGGRRVSVLVPSSRDPREVAELLADLDAQTDAAAIEVVVASAPGQAALPATAGGATLRRVAPVGAGSPWAERLQACVEAAATPLLFVAMPGDRFRADTIAMLRRELDEHADAMLAFASEGWTTIDVARFDPSACIAFRCAPPFSRERLQASPGFGAHALWRRTLHERHGAFDASFGAATEYEFWLRCRVATVRQLPHLLSTSDARASWRRERDVECDPQQRERARRRHLGEGAPAWSELRSLPATLCAPGISEEASSHARLSVIADGERRDLQSLEAFVGTALLHGDVETAICLLRAAIVGAPQLLSTRLALADLLRATGRPHEAVLLAAREHHPYRRVIDARLGAAATAAPEPRQVAATRIERTPCPTP